MINHVYPKVYLGKRKTKEIADLIIIEVSTHQNLDAAG